MNWRKYHWRIHASECVKVTLLGDSLPAEGSYEVVEVTNKFEISDQDMKNFS